MRFEEITYCPYPAPLVYQTMLHKVHQLIPYMPNITEIVDERFDDESEPGKVFTARRWQATSSTIPLLMRPFVSKDAMAWVDYATWTVSDFRIDWRTETNHSRYSACWGTSLYEPDPERPDTHTRCRISGEVVVDGAKIPAIPAIIGKKMAPKLEQIVLSYMIPNFHSLAEGLEAYLNAQD